MQAKSYGQALIGMERRGGNRPKISPIFSAQTFYYHHQPRRLLSSSSQSPGMFLDGLNHTWTLIWPDKFHLTLLFLDTLISGKYLMKFSNDIGEVFLFWQCLKMILQPCGYCSRVVVTKKLRFLPCWFSTLILLVCLHFTNQCVKRYLWSVKFCQNQRFSTLCLDKALSIKEWQRFHDCHLLPFHGEKSDDSSEWPDNKFYSYSLEESFPALVFPPLVITQRMGKVIEIPAQICIDPLLLFYPRSSALYSSHDLVNASIAITAASSIIASLSPFLCCLNNLSTNIWHWYLCCLSSRLRI